MLKKLLTYGFAALLSALVLMQSVQAISMGGGMTTRGSSSNEDTWDVDPIDSGDYDEGTRYCEGASHEYIHYNDSTNTKSKEYWGFVHAFAIAFGDDFLESVDTDTNFLCSDGANTYRNCNFDKEDDLGKVIYSRSGGTYYGVTVTYQTLNWIAGSPKGLLWEYGTDDPSNLAYKPAMESGEQKTEGISFQLEDYNSDQTATTSSWTKMEYYYINPLATSAQRSDISNYTHVYTSQVAPHSSDLDPDGDYIYWYGLNGTVVSNFPSCAVGCTDLSIDPSSFSINDVFTNLNLTLTATGSDNSDITADSKFTYSINRYGSGSSAGDAYGRIHYFGARNLNSSNGPFETKDYEVEWTNTDPGDTLYVYVSDYEGVDYGGTGVCELTLQMPYCTDLDITSPFTGGVQYGDIYTKNLRIDVDAGNEATAWPFDVTYSSTDADATFDGNTQPYTTTDWTVAYESNETGRITVGLDDYDGDGRSDDVAGLCEDELPYILVPPIITCDYLEITIPVTQPVTVEIMEAGEVEITWESYMTDGSDATGPWEVRAINNPSGEFRLTPGGPVVSTGGVATVAVTTVYYTGEAGDIIMVSDSNPSYSAACQDLLLSEAAEELPVCEDITLGDPYITNDDGTSTTLDFTDEEDIAALYEDNVVCWDFSVAVEDATFAGTLVAEGNDSSGTANGNLSLSVNETGTSDVGNPASVSVSGSATYTGTLCWENYEAGNTVSLYMATEEDACYVEETLPTKAEEAPYCVDLAMAPDTYTLSASDTATPTFPLTTVITGSDATWTGTVIVTETGSGILYYSNSSSSEFSDGHLEIPVSGVSAEILFYYTGGVEGDSITAYVEDAFGECNDNLIITQGDTPVISDDDVSDDDSDYDDRVCEDIGFEEDSFEVAYTCEDIDTELCNDADYTQTIEVCYEDEDGDDGIFTLDGEENEGCEEITLSAGECVDVEFEEVCEGSEIEVREDETVCDEIDVEEEKEEIPGEFSKFIFTFNFSTEKNPYTDEGVFFAHDEDRAFYTLEYDPAGPEDQIVFTDSMWEGDLSSSYGGAVRLATTATELTSATAYDQYESIRAMGFGDKHEENTDEIASTVESMFSSGNYMSFIPYIKFDSSTEAIMIEECAYDEEGELSSETVCFDPNHSPADTADVVIENAGSVVDDYGSNASIRIRYVGIIDSGLDCGSTEDDCLTEEFTNNAQVEIYKDYALEADARLVVLCSYLLTQNAGDVYLEVTLDGGSDLSCIYIDETFNYASYANTDALVILDDSAEDEDEAEDGGTGASVTYEYASSTISICDEEGSNTVIGNLSSYICEIVNSVSELWKKTTVESTTKSRVNQATRNAVTNQSSSFGDASNPADWTELKNALTNLNNPDSNILYFDGSISDALYLDYLTVEAGAWTVIVENADLHLTDNIAYKNVQSSSGYKNLPSVAFVVLGGNIYVENSAYHLVGVYYTDQIFDGDSDGSSRSAVDGFLTVNGSLYGNIQALMNDARYVAPPTDSGGGLVIRYDSRILLNTPPALSEYVDVQSREAVNNY